MSSPEHHELMLPTLLDELAAPRTPVYFDDILHQVGRTRQRPGWTFLERWLPMSAVSNRLALAPRVPIRGLLVAALLVVAIAVAAVLIAGNQRHVPAPFGPAANGVVAFVDSRGAIRTGDLGTRTSTVVVSGPGHSRPVFSPDGTRLVYLQQRDGGEFDVMTSLADGSGASVLTSKPFTSVGHLGWTPDGRKVVVASASVLVAFDLAKRGDPTVISDKIQTDFADLDDFNASLSDLFRPPTGDEILYVAASSEGAALYRQPLAGGEPTAVLTARTSPVKYGALGGAQWSPDGTQIALTLRPPNATDLGRIYVMNADGTGLRRLSHLNVADNVIDEEHPAWSPDGTRIAFMRWDYTRDGDEKTRPVTIVNVATGDEKELPNLEVNGFHSFAWAPDGTSILEVAGVGSKDVDRVLLVDPATGTIMDAGWNSPDAVSFQRLAR